MIEGYFPQNHHISQTHLPTFPQLWPKTKYVEKVWSGAEFLEETAISKHKALVILVFVACVVLKQKVHLCFCFLILNAKLQTSRRRLLAEFKPESLVWEKFMMT